jgi:hypothetical protein
MLSFGLGGWVAEGTVESFLPLGVGGVLAVIAGSRDSSKCVVELDIDQVIRRYARGDLTDDIGNFWDEKVVRVAHSSVSLHAELHWHGIPIPFLADEVQHSDVSPFPIDTRAWRSQSGTGVEPAKISQVPLVPPS